mmetsp:Transcript_5569/g.20953  ORF Transcript_5569/g.20953 Transcript_5569/m.20953 type:complete len:117 (+) Transcript_5569:508-858(+)
MFTVNKHIPPMSLNAVDKFMKYDSNASTAAGTMGLFLSTALIIRSMKKKTKPERHESDAGIHKKKNVIEWKIQNSFCMGIASKSTQMTIMNENSIPEGTNTLSIGGNIVEKTRMVW